MYRSVMCAHCGTVVALEPRTDPVGTQLQIHLRAVHREVVSSEELPRWAQLLEHFFVVPSRVDEAARTKPW
jgi:hypothetical protein